MIITKETTIGELFRVGIVENDIYSFLQEEGIRKVEDVQMRSRDYFFYDSLKANVQLFVSFLVELTDFYKKYEDGLIENDNEVILPTSLIFTIRSIYQNESKRYSAEYILSTILSDESDIFIYNFVFNIFTNPREFFDENRIKGKLLNDVLISQNIDKEWERYNYVMISIITKISSALNNFPDGIYYKRLLGISIKEIGINLNTIEKAEEYAKLLNYHATTNTEDDSKNSPSIDVMLQKQYEDLQITLSVRTRNIINNNIPSYKDMLPWVGRNPKDFNFRGCGMKSKIEIRGFIDSFSDFYYKYLESPSYKKREEQIDANRIKTISFLIQNECEKRGSNGPNIINFLFEVYPDLALLSEDIAKFPEQIYVRLNEHNKQKALDCIDLLIQLCSNINLSIKNHEDYKEFISIFSDTISVLSELRNKNLRELEHNKYINSDKENLLQQEYSKLVLQCSMQCQNVISNNNIGYKDLLTYNGRESEFHNFRNVGRKCEMELTNLLKKFDITYLKVLNNDTKEARLLKYQNDFPFLCENDIVFIDYFYSCYKHFPMFYIFNKYFKSSNNKQACIFASYYGLCENALFNLKKIADYYGCSRERVRQIVYKRSFADKTYKKIINPSLWESYNLNEESIITQYSSKFENIKIEEKTDISFYAYSCLLRLLVDVEVFNITNSLKGLSQTEIGDYIIKGHPFNTYIFSAQFRDFKFLSALKEVGRLIHLRRDSTIKIPLLSYFITNMEYWVEEKELETAQTNKLLEIFEVIIRDFYADSIKDHYLVLKANKINYADIFYNIIKEYGESMHLQDIFERYKVLYPDSKYEEAKQIKPHLFSDGRIKSIGRSSIFTLAEWNDYTGNLFELAVDLVKATNKPIKIDNLVKEMLVYRPSSTERSVRSIIYLCIKDSLLILFCGDYVGIPNREYEGDYIQQPRTFDEWIAAFKNFTIHNKCFPIGTNKGFEGSLYGWYYDARSYSNMTSEEILSFHSLMEELKLIPHNLTERKFLNNCEMYETFVRQSGRMLTQEDDSSLYAWYNNNIVKYVTYNDNRRQYFKDLINFLQLKFGSI